MLCCFTHTQFVCGTPTLQLDKKDGPAVSNVVIGLFVFVLCGSGRCIAPAHSASPTIPTDCPSLAGDVDLLLGLLVRSQPLWSRSIVGVFCVTAAFSVVPILDIVAHKKDPPANIPPYRFAVVFQLLQSIQAGFPVGG